MMLFHNSMTLLTVMCLFFAEIYYLINDMVPFVVKYTLAFGTGVSTGSFNFSEESTQYTFY